MDFLYSFNIQTDQKHAALVSVLGFLLICLPELLPKTRTMNTKRALLLLLAIIPFVLSGQKKPLTHADYDGWKNLGSSSITDDGRWISYEINPQEGDGNLYLYDAKGTVIESFERGYGFTFSGNGDFFSYLIKPAFNETRQAKKDKKKPDEMPKTNLGIKVPGSGRADIIERVKSFKVGSDVGSWIAYLMEKPVPGKKEEVNTDEGAAPGQGRRAAGGRAGGGAGGGNGQDVEGTDLVIRNPVENLSHTFKDVTDYVVSDDGSAFGFVQVTTDSTKINHYKVTLFNAGTEATNAIFNGDGALKSLTLYEDGSKLAFLYTSDTSKVKVYDLFYSDGAMANKIIGTETAGMPQGWSVSENGSLQFSESGNRIFFGTNEKPVEEPEDTLLTEEKYSLDIWSWQDPLLQPQQKIELSRERRKTYLAVYHIAEKRMVQLADGKMPDVSVFMNRNSDLAHGSSDLKYRIMTSWDANRYTDHYLVNVKTGERSLLMEAAPSSVSFSPSGKWMLYWCIETKSWLAQPTAGGKAINLTKELDVPFFDLLHDSPSEPRPEGISEWIEGERYVLINDSYDIWKMDVTGAEKPVNLTNGFGRKNNMQFRYNSLGSGGGGFRGRRSGGGGDRDKFYLEEKETIYLDAFHNFTKQSGLYTVRVNRPADPVKIDLGDYSYRSMVRAKDADRLIFQRGDYVNYPELYISDMNLANAVKISNTNPQQADYNWGTVELVEWMSFDGQKLQGLLYKPEDFDPSKKYPMIAYFYERSSQGLHSYLAPSPSASTINRTFAVSNGYLIFVPDIPYVEGYPGQSCYNAVVSGTYALLNQFDFIDPDRLGLDGQSWGGYQIAYLITQTDLFACAYAGAPVSNMTSAYGGIRWQTGISRMHQYEQTQSRIGATLWERPMQYIENSPIFYVPKINTPVLIMHNDEDGAVPWYQGIEFFVALRRLGKPAWMLTYNNEAHNLTKSPNKKDLSVRKFQFFDHYLKNAPMPYWMANGISQDEKGKISGYELMK